MKETTNTSVLVIDDEEMVRDNIEEILMPRKMSPQAESVEMAASILFDTPQLLPSRTSNIPNFKVDKASTGMEGVEDGKKIGGGGPTLCRDLFGHAQMPGWDEYGDRHADQEIRQ